MFLERVTAASSEVLEALQRLVPQLTQNNPPPTAGQLADMLASEHNVLIIAREPDADGRIVGAGSLGVYAVPTGIRAVIEDVVVDSAARGLGIGEAITRRLLESAHALGAPGVSLTSNPAREAANRLYLRMGFVLRETNCYYYRFPH